MLSILLSIIGLICIVISLIYINKIFKNEKNMYEEIITIHGNIKDYSHAIDDTLNNFDDLIGTSLNKFEKMETNSIHFPETKMSRKGSLNKEINQQFKKSVIDNSKKAEDSTIVLYEKIMSLKTLGLSNGEIAKKLNKGVREVEIILKMGNNI